MKKEGWGSTEISVLDVTSWLALRLDDIVTLFGQVLDEHFLRESKQLLS